MSKQKELLRNLKPKTDSKKHIIHYLVAVCAPEEGH